MPSYTLASGRIATTPCDRSIVAREERLEGDVGGGCPTLPIHDCSRLCSCFANSPFRACRSELCVLDTPIIAVRAVLYSMLLLSLLALPELKSCVWHVRCFSASAVGHKWVRPDMQI